MIFNLEGSAIEEYKKKPVGGPKRQGGVIRGNKTNEVD